MDSVIRIIQAAGHDGVEALDVNDLIEIENEPFMDLSVEKLADDRLSVAHYYTQRGDLMSDPEIVFDVSGDEWVPIEYTQHGVPQVHERDEDGLEMKSFLNGWNSRLREQGFIDKAESKFKYDNE